MENMLSLFSPINKTNKRSASYVNPQRIHISVFERLFIKSPALIVSSANLLNSPKRQKTRHKFIGKL